MANEFFSVPVLTNPSPELSALLKATQTAFDRIVEKLDELEREIDALAAN